MPRSIKNHAVFGAVSALMASLSLMTGAANGGWTRERTMGTAPVACCVVPRDTRDPTPAGADVIAPREAGSAVEDRDVLTDVIAAELIENLEATLAKLPARRSETPDGSLSAPAAPPCPPPR